MFLQFRASILQVFRRLQNPSAIWKKNLYGPMIVAKHTLNERPRAHPMSTRPRADSGRVLAVVASELKTLALSW